MIEIGEKMKLRKGEERRKIEMEDFLIEYGKKDSGEGELVEDVNVKIKGEGRRFEE